MWQCGMGCNDCILRNDSWCFVVFAPIHLNAVSFSDVLDLLALTFSSFAHLVKPFAYGMFCTIIFQRSCRVDKSVIPLRNRWVAVGRAGQDGAEAAWGFTGADYGVAPMVPFSVCDFGRIPGQKRVSLAFLYVVFQLRVCNN